MRVNLLGRYMLETRQEFPCEVIDISPGGALLKAPAVGRVGERVIVYLEQIGRIEGKVTRLTPSGFAMTIATTMRKRDKLASQLTWLANRALLGLPEDRRHFRIVPNNPLTIVTLPDGARINARVIDISLSGAAFVTDARLKAGGPITIGSTPARVVRVSENGVAAEFVTPFSPDNFDESIIL